MPCKPWPGRARDSYGYAVKVVNGKKIKAHRFVWFEHFGTWPEGDLDHLCHDETCVAPCPHRVCVEITHLAESSRRENVLRGNGLTARHARATVCPQGHALPPYVRGGKRRCATCARDDDRRYRARRREMART